MLIGSLVEVGELSDERRVPGVERRKVVYVGIMKNICSEVVGDGGLSAGTE